MGSAHGWSQSFQCKEQTCINLSQRSQQLENISLQPQQNSSSWCWCENHENHLSGFQLYAQPWAPGRHSLFFIPCSTLGWAGCTTPEEKAGKAAQGTGHCCPPWWAPLLCTQGGSYSLATKISQGKIRKLKNPSITLSAGKNEFDSWIWKKPYF